MIEKIEKTGWALLLVGAGLLVLALGVGLVGFIIFLGQQWYASSNPGPCRDAVVAAGSYSGPVSCSHPEHVMVTDMTTSALCKCIKP